jgi:hypothetical protein
MRMKGAARERWMELAELAANEQDPQRLLELVREINALLEAKSRRLESGNSGSSPEPKSN